MPDVDVIVTAIGGADTAEAVLEGGGLVGIRSSATAPPGVDVEFVDWPFEAEDVSVQEHVDVVRQHEPRYAVAPDVQRDRALEDVVAVADELRRYAGAVIVVPKTVPVGRVPRRFRVGVPFRDNFQTDTGVNTFLDFQGRPVHVLGGNPTDQFGLVDEFGLDVRSVDSPVVLSWADFGRVWVGQARGADEVIELLEDSSVDPIALEHAAGVGDPILLRRSRRERIAFSVRNLVNAWQNDGVVKLPVRVAPGRGPRPPMDEPIDVFGERLSIEEQRERFLEGVMELEVGRADPDVPMSVRTSFERFAETDRSAEEEPEGMADEDDKRAYFANLQEESDAAVEELGLGPGALPDRDEE